MHNKCVCDIPWKRSVEVLEKTDKFLLSWVIFMFIAFHVDLVFEHDTGNKGKKVKLWLKQRVIMKLIN